MSAKQPEKKTGSTRLVKIRTQHDGVQSKYILLSLRTMK